MNKKILLTIKGSHMTAEGESSTVELITEGRLFQKDGVYYIEYEESEISGKQGTKTLISINNNSVFMLRSGTSSSQLLFEEGKKYTNSCLTPFGEIQMEIYPTKVEHEINEDQGRVDLKYQLAIDGISTGINELKMSYR